VLQQNASRDLKEAHAKAMLPRPDVSKLKKPPKDPKKAEDELGEMRRSVQALYHGRRHGWHLVLFRQSGAHDCRRARGALRRRLCIFACPMGSALMKPNSRHSVDVCSRSAFCLRAGQWLFESGLPLDRVEGTWIGHAF
jgi:hypothetical protein